MSNKRSNYYSRLVDPFPDFNFEVITENANLWKQKRGFIPKEPKVWNNKLAFPLYDVSGEFQQYQIRSHSNHQFDKERYKLTGSIEDPVHQTDSEVLETKYILVEGTADCALLRNYGINAVTCLGADKFRVLRARDFLTGNNFFYFFDNDFWGDKASQYMEGSTGFRLSLMTGDKDINDFFLRSKKEFEEWIKSYNSLFLS